MEKYVEIIKKMAGNVKGISIGITDKTTTVFEHYYGIIDDKKTPNSADRMMMIGSNTKLFTTIGILQLMEQGKLTLDDDIRTYIPTLNIPANFDYDKITIRNVLMHRSGIPCDDYSLIFNEDKTYEELIEALNHSLMVTLPDTMYAYSNLAYTLLGVIIENISGLKYQDYLEENIAKPLGIKVMILPNMEAKKAHLDQISRSFTKEGKVVFDRLGTTIPAGSNTYTTLNGLLTLMRCFLDPKNQPLLKPESFQLMMEKPDDKNYLENELRHGIGIYFNSFNAVNEETGDLIGHGGDTIYHHSDFKFFPKLGIGIAFLTNTETGRIVGNKLMKAILEEYLKTRDILLPNFKVEETAFVEMDPSLYAKDYASIGTMLKMKVNQKNQLIAKMSFLSSLVQMREDGWLQLKPKGIAKLPIFGKIVKNLLLYPSVIMDENVLYIKQYQNGNYAITPLFSEYKKPQNESEYNEIVGQYECLTTFGGEDRLFSKASIQWKNGFLYFQTTFQNQIMKLHLQYYKEGQYQIAGYGRGTHEIARVTHTDGKLYFNIYGVVLQKIQK